MTFCNYYQEHRIVGLLLTVTCSNRTDHLYAFFIQWSPEIYAEDTGEYTREPGFIVVKKIEESETNEDSTNEAAAREWEVRRKM